MRRLSAANAKAKAAGRSEFRSCLIAPGCATAASVPAGVWNATASIGQREALSGTYTLDADCTGTMTLEGQLGGTAHWDMFVTSDGKKGRMIRTDAGTAGVRTFEQ